MATGLLARPLERSYLLVALRGLYRRRLTARGRFLLWASIALGLVGIDTRRGVVFMLFALAAPPLLLALGRLFGRRPAVRLEGRLPERLTAGRPVAAFLDVRPRDTRAERLLSLLWAGPLPDPEALAVTPEETAFDVEAGSSARVRIDLHPRRRGRHVLPAPGVARTDPFGLVRTKAVWLKGPVVLVYPRFYTLDALALPAGRRYQPGGIPLASEIGDSLEFVGTREYHEGDPLRKIHWRSWARLGRPVVRESRRSTSRGSPSSSTPSSRAGPARGSASASRRRSRSSRPWPSTSAAPRRSWTSSPPDPTSTR